MILGFAVTYGIFEEVRPPFPSLSFRGRQRKSYLQLGPRCFARLCPTSSATPSIRLFQWTQLKQVQVLTSFQHYLSHWTLSGSRDTVGVVGTTTNGVMYLSMPVLFAALSRRWAHLRRTTAFCGVVLACLGFFTSSWSTAAGHLVLTQGTLAALGCALGTYGCCYDCSHRTFGDGFSDSFVPLIPTLVKRSTDKPCSVHSIHISPERILLDEQPGHRLWCSPVLQKHNRLGVPFPHAVSP